MLSDENFQRGAGTAILRLIAVIVAIHIFVAAVAALRYDGSWCGGIDLISPRICSPWQAAVFAAVIALLITGALIVPALVIAYFAGGYLAWRGAQPNEGNSKH